MLWKNQIFISYFLSWDVWKFIIRLRYARGILRQCEICKLIKSVLNGAVMESFGGRDIWVWGFCLKFVSLGTFSKFLMFFLRFRDRNWKENSTNYWEMSYLTRQLFEKRRKKRTGGYSTLKLVNFELLQGLENVKT